MKVDDLFEAKDHTAAELVKAVRSAIKPLGVMANPDEKRETPGAFRFWFLFKDKNSQPPADEVISVMKKAFPNRTFKSKKTHDGYAVNDLDKDVVILFQEHGGSSSRHCLYVQVNKNNEAGEDNRHGFDK